MVFAATGSASFDFYGVNRHGDNLFANCVLALDARTGKPHLAFPGDSSTICGTGTSPLRRRSSPSRATGATVDAVAQITKTGFVFVLDRKTGQPLFPIE